MALTLPRPADTGKHGLNPYTAHEGLHLGDAAGRGQSRLQGGGRIATDSEERPAKHAKGVNGVGRAICTGHAVYCKIKR